MDVIEPEELSCLKDQFVNLDELKEDVKMKMNVCWRRKDTQIETDPCVIQDVIELPESEYARFYQNLLDDYDFIAEHQDAMFYKDGQEHALLVLGEGQKDGILVSSEGTNYARYSSFIPHAREIVQDDIRRLADYCIREGTANSEDGSWAVTYEELSCHFDEAAVSSQNGFGKLLKEELRQREEIKELIMTEDCIEMTYHMEYCENCQQGALEGAMNLFSCALPGFVDSKNEEKTERNAVYLVVSQSGGGMVRQGTRKGIRRTPANRGMRAHRVVKGLDISEDVCHGLCP